MLYSFYYSMYACTLEADDDLHAAGKAHDELGKAGLKYNHMKFLPMATCQDCGRDGREMRFYDVENNVVGTLHSSHSLTCPVHFI